MAELAEEMATFFEDEKLRAQNRIRRCEMFMNDSRLQSKSVREGLICLLRNAEDDYSTLLHLERVMNMRECGDFSASGGASANTAAPLPNKACDNDLDDPFEGEGFVMGGIERQSPQPPPEVRGGARAADGVDDLDPLFPIMDEGVKKLSVVSPSKHQQRRSSGGSRKAFKRPSITGDQLDEIDEAEDDGADSAVNGRRIRTPGSQSSVAHSLPVNIPLPEIRNKLLDSDLDEEDEDGEKRDIPKKIAEIARSLYDQVEEIASSPTSTKFTQII